MTDLIKKNINIVRNKINLIKKNSREVNLIVISKHISSDKIQKAIDCGQMIFGENTTQETKKKWPELKKRNPNIKLHLVGHLQSNKARDAIAIFDVIQTLDSIKLAKILQKEIIKQKKNPQIFIQINVGKEKQKNGINTDEIDNFIKELSNLKELNICGIMSIAPKNQDPNKYFQETYNLAKKYNLPNISMGMSSDFDIAIENGANFIRIGTAIFGSR